jgi:hypothetical protein
MDVKAMNEKMHAFVASITAEVVSCLYALSIIRGKSTLSAIGNASENEEVR